MASKIWFIQNEEEETLRAFVSRHDAEYEMEALEREEAGEGLFSLYAIDVDDLEDFPIEMEIATEEGLI